MRNLGFRLITIFIVCAMTSCGSSDRESSISQQELLSRINNNSAPTIIDVRSREEYDSGHVPGALHISVADIEKDITQLNLKSSEEIVLYCEKGGRASKAQTLLQDMGYYEVRHLRGDMQQWRVENLPCEGC